MQKSILLSAIKKAVKEDKDVDKMCSLWWSGQTTESRRIMHTRWTNLFVYIKKKAIKA